MDEKTHVLSIEFDEELKAGDKGTLTIAYSGTINDKMAGFYRSTYTDNGVKKYLMYVSHT